MFRLLIIFFLCSSNFCLGQKIEGKYVLVQSDQGVRTLDFANGFFSDTSIGHLNSAVIGKGTYKVENGKIVLRYLKQMDQDTSIYTIDSRQAGDFKANVSVRILDENNLSMPAWIDLLDHKKQILVKLVNSGKEESNFIVAGPPVTSVRVSYLGYRSVDVMTKSLMGKNSTITVSMRPLNQVFREPGEVTYEIKNINHESLTIYVKGGEELRFLRESGIK
jgi:hypothetical protein